MSEARCTLRLMYQSPEAAFFARSILWLVKRKVGVSFLLGVASWILLTLAWNQSQQGSLTFRFIATIMRPGFTAGDHIARLVNASGANGALIHLAALLLMYTVFWYVVILLLARLRTETRIGDEQGSGPADYHD